jgi:diguanylate cyclase (GGDEF)-like protein/PAS domain S-box-containing protein
VRVPSSELQDKSARYYFQETMKLRPGEIYVSPLDLNVEKGRIEQPFKPTLRICMRLADSRGNGKGILVLNYLGQTMLTRFADEMRGSWGEPMLLNGDGYWLLAPDQADEWGFMLQNGRSFKTRYPDAWAAISAAPSGVVQVPSGLLIFSTAYARDAIAGKPDSAQQAPFPGFPWKIVVRLPSEAIDYHPLHNLRTTGLPLALLLSLVAATALLLAWLRTNYVRRLTDLTESRRMLSEAQEVARVGSWEWNFRSNSLSWSDEVYQLFEVDREHFSPSYDAFLERVHPDDRATVNRAVEDALRRDKAYDIEHRILKPGGGERFVHERGKVEHGHDGRTVRMLGTIQDITERKQSEEKLRQAATVFESTNEAIIVTDASHKIIAVNQAFTSITGYDKEDVAGREPSLLKSGKHDNAFYTELEASLARSGQWRGEIWNRKKTGEIFPAWESISAVIGEQGKISHYVSIFTDISDIKEAAERLTHLAHHDALTELPNRLRFNANLDQAIQHARRNGKSLALLFIDLDRFKLINDTLGHSAGDRLLQTIASRLLLCVREEDTVARLGGDEFTILLNEIQHGQDAAHIAEKIIAAVCQPLRLNGKEVVVSASIGISIFPDDGNNAEDLARTADAAMYQAKAHGRNTYRFYTEMLTTRAREILAIENGLRRALDHGELAVYYQPQVSVATGEVVGVEALLRWIHPERGLIYPADFIAVAEESGLVDQIGTWLIGTACSHARAWRLAGVAPLRMAINISSRQLTHDHLAQVVRSACAEAGLLPGDIALELEITEGLLRAEDQVITTLREIQQLGVQLAIDDFGTGYSSLSHLKNLPVDRLKIAREFVEDIEHSQDARAIIDAIIAMGHSLDLKIIAEGVETAEQLAFLRERRCDEFQGYHFSEAVPHTEIPALVRHKAKHGAIN